MKNEVIKITYNSKITPIKPINDAFTLCKCYVMAIGKNSNKTIVAKKVVDDAIPTLFNVPVVGHLFIDADGESRMGGHDIVVEKDTNGKYLLKSITVPYGVVPQQDNLHYETVEEKDGTENVYLVADIILWTGRYPELLDATYNEDIYFAQSMEILPLDTKQNTDGLEVKKFQFSALCLLGKSDDKTKNVIPCFKSAKVEPYKFSNDENWTELFTEFKDQLGKSYSAQCVVKGGKKVLNTEIIKKILIEFGLEENIELSFEVTQEMTEDEFKNKIKEKYFQNNEIVTKEDGFEEHANVTTEAVETNSESITETETIVAKPTSGNPLLFTVDLTYEEKRLALSKAFDAQNNHNEDFYVWYCMIDFDDSYTYSYRHFSSKNTEESEKIRIPYIFLDDEARLDMDKKEKVRLVWLTKADEAKLAADETLLSELEQYKKKRLEEDKRQSCAAVISEFSDLGELDEYKAIIKDAMNFESTEALSEKLYALRGKNAGIIAKKPLDKVRIPVGFTDNQSKQSEYDDFMSRYLAKNK